MAGLVSQINTIQQGNDILTRATRSAAQFWNSANSLIAELQAYEATLPNAGLDADTLAEIVALKTQTIAAVQAELTNLQTALSQA